MFNRIPTSTLNMILLIGAALLIVEVVFFSGGLIFSLLFSCFLIFIGKRKYNRLIGKILFWLGIVTLIIAILKMFVIKLFIIGIVLFLLYRYYQSKKEPQRLRLSVYQENKPFEDEPLINVEPLFKNAFLGDLKTPEHPYEWRDINIQGGFGDRIIDLSNTVLPDGEAIISIRHFVGKLIIYIPYEVEVSIHHSSLFGRVNIFNTGHKRLMSQTISYHTANYFHERSKVKMITSIFSGDIEVKRI